MGSFPLRHPAEAHLSTRGRRQPPKRPLRGTWPPRLPGSRSSSELHNAPALPPRGACRHQEGHQGTAPLRLLHAYRTGFKPAVELSPAYYFRRAALRSLFKSTACQTTSLSTFMAIHHQLGRACATVVSLRAQKSPGLALRTSHCGCSSYLVLQRPA